MKAQIHPQWYPEAKVTCACGNTFVLGLAVPELHIDVCSNCHPFYTGQMRFVDTKGRVDKFISRQKNSTGFLSKKARRVQKRLSQVEKELSRPTSLGELR